MAIGDTLAIVLDDGEPIRNVPASFRAEIVHAGRIGDYGGAAQLHIASDPLHQPVQLQQGVHVLHLIKADLKEEPAEFYQSLI